MPDDPVQSIDDDAFVYQYRDPIAHPEEAVHVVRDHDDGEVEVGVQVGDKLVDFSE